MGNSAMKRSKSVNDWQSTLMEDYELQLLADILPRSAEYLGNVALGLSTETVKQILLTDRGLSEDNRMKLEQKRKLHLLLEWKKSCSRPDARMLDKLLRKAGYEESSYMRILKYNCKAGHVGDSMGILKSYKNRNVETESNNNSNDNALIKETDSCLSSKSTVELKTVAFYVREDAKGESNDTDMIELVDAATQTNPQPDMKVKVKKQPKTSILKSTGNGNTANKYVKTISFDNDVSVAEFDTTSGNMHKPDNRTKRAHSEQWENLLTNLF